MNTQETSTCNERPNKIEQFVYDWAASNMFLFRRWDGLCYIFFYIIIPIVLALIGLHTSQNDAALANCYLSIVISALNCLYDTFGRWNDNMPTKKIKLSVIMFCCFVVFTYAFIQFAAGLAGDIQAFRNDMILCMYAPAVIIGALDAGSLLSRTDALKELVKD